MDFPLSSWRQAIDYFQDDPDERLNWLGHWLYENTYNYFQELYNKYEEIEKDQVIDFSTHESHFVTAARIVGEFLSGMEWSAIKDAISGGGPNLKRYEIYLKEVIEQALQYPPLHQELSDWAKYMTEFWEHFKTVKLKDAPEGGNKPIFNNDLWQSEY
jgi:hypothetical protein